MTMLECAFSHAGWAIVWMDSDWNLPSLGADPDTITMSGFSGGSYQTSMMSVIHSDLIKGVGLFNGGPYANSVLDRDTPDEGKSIAEAYRYEAAGAIPSLANLKDYPVYIHSGLKDNVVPGRIQDD